MTEVMFDEGDWQIIKWNYGAEYPWIFYLRHKHPIDRYIPGASDLTYKVKGRWVCQACSIAPPDSVLALFTLLRGEI